MDFVVSRKGKILDSTEYSWDSETRTFSCNYFGCTLDFGNLENITINCGSGCKINCRDDCIINCIDSCVISCGSNCRINCRDFCILRAETCCIINGGTDCHIIIISNCFIKCGDNCYIKGGSNNTINCSNDCIVKCHVDCSIICGSNCNIQPQCRTIIFPGDCCKIRYNYDTINIFENLTPNQYQQISIDGDLKILKEIKYDKIFYIHELFCFKLTKYQIFKFNVKDSNNEELFKAISEDNHTKILMLENDQNHEFIKHYLKTFTKEIQNDNC